MRYVVSVLYKQMEKKCKVNGKEVLCYEIELVLCKFFEMCIFTSSKQRSDPPCDCEKNEQIQVMTPNYYLNK